MTSTTLRRFYYACWLVAFATSLVVMFRAPLVRKEIGEEQISSMLFPFFLSNIQSILPFFFFLSKNRKVAEFTIDGERVFLIAGAIVLYFLMTIGGMIWVFVLSSYNYGDLVSPPPGNSLESRFGLTQSLVSALGLLLSMPISWLCYRPEQKTKLEQKT